jgi:xanthine dehydrogenase small subunit
MTAAEPASKRFCGLRGRTGEMKMQNRRRVKVRDTIRFLFGQTERVIHNPSPTMTVLEWLRGETRACGTKEGCAEGDCGACTVALGEPEADGMRWRAVNACILFLPALDGKQLLTVEHLSAPDGTLHPVQQAMVTLHGSQCGFCTPGFVMSLFVLYHDGRGGDRAQALAALAGNLCRCTGYRPIVDAARAACSGPPADRFAAAAAETAARLRALAGGEMLHIERDGQCFLAPRTVFDVVGALAAYPEATLLAGGTDVGLWVTKQHRALPVVIALEHVGGLADIAVEDGVLRLGAGATYEAAFAALTRHWPGMRELLLRLGSRQIRNRGTIGGNIANASPIGDMPPALIVLGATLVLRGAAGTRGLPAEDFFRGYRQTALAPGEFLERIDIPLPVPGEVFATYKVSKRFEQDISAVCGAYRLRVTGGRVEDIRIAYGGMAAVPKRCAGAERTLIGAAWTRDNVTAAMAALDAESSPIDDMRASAAYRRLVARNLLLRLWLETTPQDGVRVRLQPLDEVAA